MKLIAPAFIFLTVLVFSSTLCFAQPKDGETKILMENFLRALTVSDIDTLLTCADDTIFESWETAAKQLSEIHDWNNKESLLIGFISLLHPITISLATVGKCSEQEIWDILGKMKQLIDNKLEFQDVVVQNLDMIAAGMKDVVQEWNNKGYEKIGQVVGTLTKLVFNL